MMTRTQVYIPQELYREACLLAQQTGKSISQIMRAGIAREISDAKRNKKSPTLLAVAGSVKLKNVKKTTIGTDHNDIYSL